MKMVETLKEEYRRKVSKYDFSFSIDYVYFYRRRNILKVRVLKDYDYYSTLKFDISNREPREVMDFIVDIYSKILFEGNF